LELISGQRLKGQYLDIDNKTFKDCVLVDCTLAYHGGGVDFLRTQVSDCRYVFDGAEDSALRALALLGSRTFHIQRWKESEQIPPSP
jgi:hypothetical protein